MTSSPYNLPTMKQLESFEAAARHLSFKKAASELGVTPSAVSHQVRGLEDHLSTSLFDRSRKQVVLTEQGEKLARDLQAAFTSLGKLTEDIRHMGQLHTVSIGAPQEIVSLWLHPIVSEYTRENDYRVYQKVSRKNESCSRERQLQIVQRSTAEPFEFDQGATELFRDKVIAVSSPEFVKRYQIRSLSALARAPLVEILSPDSTMMSWRNWFQKLDYMGDINYKHKVQNTLEALNLAMSGLGVVLAWESMMQPHFEAKKLAQIAKFSYAPESAFFLIEVEAEQMNEASIHFRDWLIARNQPRDSSKT